MAKDRFKTEHASPWVVRIVIGILLLAAIGLLAIYALRPGTSPEMTRKRLRRSARWITAQNEANAKRDEQRSATSLL